MSNFPIIACVIMTVGYLCFSVRVSDGIPESLSATYYTLGKRGWLFQALVISVGFMLLPAWINESDEGLEWLAFLSCGGLVMTGLAPAFKLRLDGAIHYTSAIVCGIASVAWVLLSGMYPVVIWWAFIGWMLYLQFGQYMWCIEVAVIGAVLTSLY